MSDYQVLAEAQRGMFLKGTPDLNVQEDDYGYPCMVVGEESIPLYTSDTTFTVVQPGSVQKDKELAKHKGKFQISFGGDENEFAEELRLLPITVINRGFVKFSGDYNSQTPAQRICWSNNGFVHEPEVAQPYSARCAVLDTSKTFPRLNPVCPEAQFINGQRPNCRAFINLAFFDIDRKVPLRIQLHGTGMKTWSDLQQDYKRALDSARRNRRNPNNYIIYATLEDNGTYYKPVFQFKYAEEGEDIAKYRNVLHWYLTTLYSNNNAAQTDAPVNTETGEVYDVDTTAETVTEIGF